MSGAALTLAAVAALIADPACGGVRVDTAEGALLRDRLMVKFRVESGLRGTDLVHPYAIRDETEGRAVAPVPRTHAEAVAVATARHAAGHVLGLGLGQITGADNLKRDFRVSAVAEAVPLAFVPCEAVAASVRHYSADIRHVLRVLDCSSLAYNAGRGRVTASTGECDSGYVRSVRALQAALPPDAAGGAVPRHGATASSPEPLPPPCAPVWDAWALADCTARASRPTPSSSGGSSTPLAMAGSPDAHPADR